MYSVTFTTKIPRIWGVEYGKEYPVIMDGEKVGSISCFYEGDKISIAAQCMVKDEKVKEMLVSKISLAMKLSEA